MTKIIQVNVSDTMKEEYTTYAMDVIKDRALPDIRDGLKPVHRRALYSLHELKVTPDKGYRKSARIVGDILGKYHPHGDTSVYDAIVRLTQSWNLRYPLVDGHGNFGSIDGDSAAAMRYTEIKQSLIMQEMINDLDKNTVDFVPNFDGEEKEPSVLPSRLPNLLINGSDGIAVGFATKIPPHNLNEIVDGVMYQINNPNCTIKDLMNFIKAPDFPTYANIINPENILSVYQNGCGKITIRATHHIETIKIGNKEKECIIFTDIPYQVNKSTLIQSIDEKSKDIVKTDSNNKKITIKAKITDIESVEDESDRNGMRIVVTLKRKGVVDIVLNALYKHTDIQSNFNVNNTVLIDNNPVEHVSLKTFIEYYIKHQQDVIFRRTIFNKEKNEKSLHILKGLNIAISDLDLTIKLIRNSKSKNEAKEKLINNLKIDELQSDAILQMQLQRLTKLEKDSLLNQINEIENNLIYLNGILNDKNKLNDVLKNELIELKKKYGDQRRTKILNNINTDIDNDLLIESYNTIIQLTKEGYIKKIRATSLKNTSKDKLKHNDYIIKEINGNNKNTILLFSNNGNVYQVKENNLYDKKSSELGELITSLIDLEKDEYIMNIISTNFNDKENLLIAFKNGKIAKISISSYSKNRTKLMNAINTNSPIVNMFTITKDIDIICQSSIGKILVINTSYINVKNSKITQGTQVMKSKNDSVMTTCVPLDNVNIDEIEDVEYYKVSSGGVGKFKKKTDNIKLI